MGDYYNKALREHIDEIARQQTQALETELIKRLAYYGYEFANKADFYSFVSERLTRIRLAEKPFHNEIRLDYHCENEPGKLIIWWSTEIKIRHEGNKVIATMG